MRNGTLAYEMNRINTVAGCSLSGYHRVPFGVGINEHTYPFTNDDFYGICREAAVLVDEVKDAGNYTAQFDGARLSSGIYFARFQSGVNMHLIKMQLLK